MFTIFMQAVEKKYQDNPEKYGGQPRKAKTKASSMKAKPTLPRGAVVVTVNRGGAGFVCAADLCVKRVSPGGLSAAAGLQVGMQLARYSAGGRPHAMGGMSWSGFKEMCKQSPYPRIFTFVPAGDDSAKHTRSSAPIAEGIADRPPRKAKGAVKDERAVLSASEVSGASKHSVPEVNAERERIQQTIAGPQVETKRKEAETAAQAEIAAQMRARDEAKAKAEEQAAATVAKAAEEAAWKSAEQAAQALKEAEQKESEAALQEQNAREARLRPSGPVNVYISPLMYVYHTTAS
jgi:flagellar biosynthesis GTPase FlhF